MDDPRQLLGAYPASPAVDVCDSETEWHQLDPPEEQHAATPEHWCDVGALRTHVSLVDQQLRVLQAQVTDMSAQLAHFGQGIQRLDLQLALQKQQQQEDIVKFMAAQAVTLSNLSMSQQAVASAPARAKARPGPRERQRQRQEEEQLQHQLKQQLQQPQPHEPATNTSEVVAESRAETHIQRVQFITPDGELTQGKNDRIEHSAEQADICKESSGESQWAGKAEDTKLVDKQHQQPKDFDGQGIFKENNLEILRGDSLDVSNHNFQVDADDSLDEASQKSFTLPLRLWLILLAALSWAIHATLGMQISGAQSLDGILGSATQLLQDTAVTTRAGRLRIDQGLHDKAAVLLNSTFLTQSIDNASATGAVDENDGAAVQRMRELGHLQLSVSDCAGAERWFSRALKLLEGDAAVTGFASTKEAHALLVGDRGFALVCAQRFQEGADVLEKALFNTGVGGAAVSSPHLVNALGFATFRLQAYTRAREIFEVAVKTHPENPVLWNNLGAASIAAGDTATAGDALYYALSKTSKLKPSSVGYYTQVFSNNVHVLRHQSMGDDGFWVPTVEIFNCMVTEVSEMVTKTDSEEFKATFHKLGAVSEDKSLDSVKLMASRSSVLALEREPLFCP